MSIIVIPQARLVADPSHRHLTNSAVTELRVADNPPKGKENLRPRFITCKVWGEAQAALAVKLSKGDVITVSGTLTLEAWSRDGVEHTKDVVRVDSFFVQKSETFFQKSETPLKKAPPPGDTADYDDGKDDGYPF